MPYALVISNDRQTVEAALEVARDRGYSTHAARNLEDARDQLRDHAADLVVADLPLPELAGLLDGELDLPAERVIALLDNPDDPPPASIRRRVRALVARPLDPDELRGHVAPPVPDAGESHPAPADAPRLGPLVGGSEPMAKLYHALEKVGPTEATVLIVGESGTGKELVAQTLHTLSPRRDGPFVAVNCGAIPENLIESELFGHEKGAFTGATQKRKGLFERACGGTLFLDEIGEMPIELQVKLLRVLETDRFMRVGGEKEVHTDIRVVAATNRNPADAVADGKLREDLLYRLGVFPIQVPPLRQRDGDLQRLASYFLGALCLQETDAHRLTAELLEHFAEYRWPGNVRELKNACWRAHIMGTGHVDLPDIFVVKHAQPEPAPHTAGRVSGSPAPVTVEGDGHQTHIRVPIGTSLADAERELIYATLRTYEDNKKQAADVLGVSLKTLYNRLHAYEEEALRDRQKRAMFQSGELPVEPATRRTGTA